MTENYMAWGIHALLAGLANKDFTALELIENALDNIAHVRDLNLYCYEAAESALDAARASDQRRQSGEAGALEGIPLAHKDLFAIAGMPTQAASKILQTFTPSYTATVIDRLQQAGSVTVGKLNQDEFAMGSATQNSCYGGAINPWRAKQGSHAGKDLIPGGSSGGSSGAVASLAIPAATGTDTGGSIRQPAALTGTVGVKPTYGRCSRYGMAAFASSLDQASILTRSIEDAARLLTIMCGHDEKDMTSSRQPVPDFTQKLNASVKGLKIGVAAEYFLDSLDDSIAKTCEAAQERFRACGAQIVPIRLPMTRFALPAYYVIAPAEASGNLARYDGVRYGYRAPDADSLEDMYRKTRGQGLGREVKRRVLIGTYVLSAGYYDAYFAKAQKVRRLICEDFAQSFTQCDMILAPTTPKTAEPIDGFGQDPVQAYLSDIFTVPASMAGLPALSLPAGLDEPTGLPIGVQLIGRAFDEVTLLNAASVFEAETGFAARASGAIQ